MQAIQVYLKLGEAISLLKPSGCNQLFCIGLEYYTKMSNLDNGQNSYLLRDVDIAKYQQLGVKILFGNWHWDYTHWDRVTSLSPSSKKLNTTIFSSNEQ